MYRVLMLSLVAFTTVAADMEKRDCARMFHPHSLRCCKKSSEVKEKIMKDDDLKECFQLPKDPVTCKHEICVAKKKGFATDDDKLDLTKFEEEMTKNIEDKDLLEDIKANCINGDIQNYGPPDFCDFVKMRHCASLQMLNHCFEWNDFGDCTQLKKVVPECVKLLA